MFVKTKKLYLRKLFTRWILIRRIYLWIKIIFLSVCKHVGTMCVQSRERQITLNSSVNPDCTFAGTYY